MKKAALAIFFIINTINLFSYSVEVVTEQYPPFNYEKDGKAGGVSTEIVKAVLEEVGIEAEINVMRWGSAYRRARSRWRENVLIYSIGRNPEREDQFHWIGVVAPFDISFYSISERSDIVVDDFNDLKRYTTGVVRGDMRDNFFKNRKEFKVERYRNSEAVLEALKNREVDLMPVAELNFPYIVEYFGYELNQFQKIYKSEELSSEGLYMAFGRNSSLEIVKIFKKGLEKIKKSGKYDEIMGNYLKYYNETEEN